MFGQSPAIVLRHNTEILSGKSTDAVPGQDTKYCLSKATKW